MIYATHKLYDRDHQMTAFRVVETEDGLVSKIYNFECEKHSMLWYDAIVLSTKNRKNCFFETLDKVIEYLECNNDSRELRAYGVTYDTDGCMLTLLK